MVSHWHGYLTAISLAVSEVPSGVYICDQKSYYYKFDYQLYT